MLTRKQLEEWGHDAGEYRGTAEQLAEWLDYCTMPLDLNTVEEWKASFDAARAWLESK